MCSAFTENGGIKGQNFAEPGLSHIEEGAITMKQVADLLVQ